MAILKLKPSGKDYIWGGHKLVDNYGKEMTGDRLAETWELSCHPDGPSFVANGEDAGKTLRQYIEEHGKKVLGTNCERFEVYHGTPAPHSAASAAWHPECRYAAASAVWTDPCAQRYGKTGSAGIQADANPSLLTSPFGAGPHQPGSLPLRQIGRHGN